MILLYSLTACGLKSLFFLSGLSTDILCKARTSKMQTSGCDILLTLGMSTPTNCFLHRLHFRQESNASPSLMESKQSQCVLTTLLKGGWGLVFLYQQLLKAEQALGHYMEQSASNEPEHDLRWQNKVCGGGGFQPRKTS